MVPSTVTVSCGQSTSENCSYLVLTPTTSPSTNPCLFEICKASSKICRIRLDFVVSSFLVHHHTLHDSCFSRRNSSLQVLRPRQLLSQLLRVLWTEVLVTVQQTHLPSTLLAMLDHRSSVEQTLAITVIMFFAFIRTFSFILTFCSVHGSIRQLQ